MKINDLKTYIKNIKPSANGGICYGDMPYRGSSIDIEYLKINNYEWYYRCFITPKNRDSIAKIGFILTNCNDPNYNGIFANNPSLNISFYNTIHLDDFNIKEKVEILEYINIKKNLFISQVNDSIEYKRCDKNNLLDYQPYPMFKLNVVDEIVFKLL